MPFLRRVVRQSTVSRWGIVQSTREAERSREMGAVRDERNNRALEEFSRQEAASGLVAYPA